MPTTRFYAIRGEHFEWARIWITDDGCLSCLSDFGNYGHWWHNAGCEFRQFLCEVDDSYLIGKLGLGQHEYDDEATLARWQRRIYELRREQQLTREAAREEWRLLRNCSDLSSEFDLHEWYLATKLDVSDGVAVYRKPMQLQTFVKRLWPLFVAALRAELAAEKHGEWTGLGFEHG